MTRHLADGVLRRLLDQPDAVSDEERAHLARCERCAGERQRIEEDRASVAAALTPGAPAQTVEQAWARLGHRLAAGEVGIDAGGLPGAAVPQQRRGGRGRLLRRPVVVTAAAVAVAIGTAAAAVAGDWLQIARPRAVSAVTLKLDDLTGLAGLSAYGTVSGMTPPAPEQVADAAAAAARTGIQVPTVADLPRGVTGSPRQLVIPKLTPRFTFSAARAEQFARSQGHRLSAMPAGLDGSGLQLQVGPGVVSVWGNGSDGAPGAPALAVARLNAPVLSSQGVDLETLRGYLLAQPGVPARVAQQLRALPGNGSVLPIPVPSDLATSTPTRVGDHQATLFRSRDGSVAAVAWIADGRLTAVLGMLDSDEVLEVARGLR